MNPAAFGSLPGSACTAGTAGSYGPDRIVRNTYDTADRVTKVQSAYATAAQSDEVTTTYTDNGLVASLTDAEGNRTSYEYDGVDRLAKTRYPSTTAGAGTSSATDYEQLTYDAGSNVTSRRLRDATSIGYTYDALGRMTLMDLSGTGIDQDIKRPHDPPASPSGRITDISQPALPVGFDPTIGGDSGGEPDIVVSATRNQTKPKRSTPAPGILQQRVCSRPLTGTANRGQTVNSRRAQVRRELAELIDMAIQTDGNLGAAYNFEVGRAASRLSPGGTWIRGGTSKEDGNILFGAITAELGITLAGATGLVTWTR